MDPTDFKRLEYRKVRVDTSKRDVKDFIAEVCVDGWRVSAVPVGALPNDPVLIFTLERERLPA